MAGIIYHSDISSAAKTSEVDYCLHQRVVDPRLVQIMKNVWNSQLVSMRVSKSIHSKHYEGRSDNWAVLLT